MAWRGILPMLGLTSDPSAPLRPPTPPREKRPKRAKQPAEDQFLSPRESRKWRQRNTRSCS